MLKIKSPWNQDEIGSIPVNNSNEIEEILVNASKVSKNKSIDFPPKERIKVLKKFCEKINDNIMNLAELATSEGGKPITDSVIEIK